MIMKKMMILFNMYDGIVDIGFDEEELKIIDMSSYHERESIHWINRYDKYKIYIQKNLRNKLQLYVIM